MKIPESWTQPKYGLGQRTKQGMIIGFFHCPDYTTMSYKLDYKWHYSVIEHPLDSYDKVLYYDESEIEPLPQEELRAQIQQEIDFHTTRLEILTKEALFLGCSISMLGNTTLVSCESDKAFIELVKNQKTMICKLTAGRRIDQIILISKEGKRTTYSLKE